MRGHIRLMGLDLVASIVGQTGVPGNVNDAPQIFRSNILALRNNAIVRKGGVSKREFD